jgi:hypothetical protein
MEQKAAPAAGIECGGWAGAGEDWDMWEGGGGLGSGFCHLNIDKLGQQHHNCRTKPLDQPACRLPLTGQGKATAPGLGPPL